MDKQHKSKQQPIYQNITIKRRHLFDEESDELANNACISGAIHSSEDVDKRN
jgi:hypothetical protein